MDSLTFQLNVAGLSLQVIGIFVGLTAILVEFVNIPLLETLTFLMEATARSFPPYDAAENALLQPFLVKRRKGNLHAIYNDSGRIMAELFVVSFYLAVNIGFFVMLFLQLFSSIQIGEKWLVIWGVILAIDHALSLLMQALIVRATNPQAFTSAGRVTRGLIYRYILNWFQSPLIFVALEVVLVTITTLNLPAWASNWFLPRPIDLSNRQDRSRYYAVYSAVTLLTGTCLLLAGVIVQPTATLMPTSTPNVSTTPASNDKQLPQLQVHYIDAGQGDSILVDYGNIDVLIDGGEESANVANLIKPYVHGDIEAVIATHYHADHIGGLIDVFKDYHVDDAFWNGEVYTTQTYLEWKLAWIIVRQLSTLLSVEMSFERGH